MHPSNTLQDCPPPHLCQKMLGNACTLCNAKVGNDKHGTCSKGLKKEFSSSNNVEHELWFCLDDTKCCVVWVVAKTYIHCGLVIVPSMWLADDQSLKGGYIDTRGD